MAVECDVLILGSGLAGIFSALHLPPGLRVVIVTKGKIHEGATWLAQGGIAAVVAPDDDLDLHVKDTIEAGKGLCHEDVVRTVIAEGPARVAELIDYGVKFSRASNGDYDLGMEGGHSRRRVLHAADMTGRAIIEALLDDVARRDDLTVLEEHAGVNLIVEDDRCVGAYAMDERTREITPFTAKATVIAPRTPLFEASQSSSTPAAPPDRGAEQPPAPQPPLQPAAGSEVDALAETRVVAAGGQPLGQVVGVVVAVEGELEGTIGPVVSGSNRLGRHPECEICLPSEWVSRHHARIEFEHGVFTIHASSDKPTIVNSERVDASELHDGDYIKLGKTTLRFRSIL